MGSNVSTFKKGHRANAIAVPRSITRSKAHRWTDTPPTNDEVVATATRNLNEDQYNVPEIITPIKILNHSINVNRPVISFRSCRIWREYFHASKYSDKLIVIFFTATWCSPCRFMAPVLDEFAAHYTDVEFDKIDVDELLEVSQEFRVQTMPAFVFCKRGREIDRVIGAKREELQWKIEKHRA